MIGGLVGGILLVVGVELFAQLSYNDTLASLDTLVSGKHPNGIQVSTARDAISGLPSESDSVNRRVTAADGRIELTWFSFFQDYHCTLLLQTRNGAPLFVGYMTPDMVRYYKGGYADVATTRSAANGAAANSDAANSARTGRGGGRRRLRGLFQIIAEERVTTELALSSEQTEELTDLDDSLEFDFIAMRSAAAVELPGIYEDFRLESETGIKELLNAQQFDRLRQIDLQRTGLRSLGRVDVAEQLALTDEQNTQLASIMINYQSANRTARRRQDYDAFLDNRELTDHKLRYLLTSDQLDQWRELQGPPGPKAPERGFRRPESPYLSVGVGLYLRVHAQRSLHPVFRFVPLPSPDSLFTQFSGSR